MVVVVVGLASDVVGLAAVVDDEELLELDELELVGGLDVVEDGRLVLDDDEVELDVELVVGFVVDVAVLDDDEVLVVDVDVVVVFLRFAAAAAAAAAPPSHVQPMHGSPPAHAVVASHCSPASESSRPSPQTEARAVHLPTRARHGGPRSGPCTARPYR